MVAPSDEDQVKSEKRLAANVRRRLFSWEEKMAVRDSEN
jgi:hypothetical protein